MSRSPCLLVTGGSGFIGSHTCLDLLEHDYDIVVIDDFSNSNPAALERVTKLSGRDVAVYDVDLRDRRRLGEVFAAHRVDGVIHFAAKKAVAESVWRPLVYYDVNVCGTVALLDAMHRFRVRDLVFSSSCSVYGQPRRCPIAEEAAGAPVSPYGRSKWMCEQVLSDACQRWDDLTVIALRYFNPIGAHPSGLLGEHPTGVPNNVLPYLAQVAVGRRSHLDVYGGDWPTRDGTCIRDYLHVLDVAEGHRLAAEHLRDQTGMRSYNLGTGSGTSVLELVTAFSAACGQELPYRITDRRPGDVPELVADASRVARDWDWRPRHDLDAMCRDAWRFQQLNPTGYDG